MRNRRIKNLIIRELRGDLMPEEQEELQQWANLSASNSAWYLHFRDKRKGIIYPGIMNRAATKKEHAKIEMDRQMEVASMGEGKVVKLWWRQPFGRVAAAVVVILTVGAMWQYLRNKLTASPELQVIVGKADDVPPGSNKAILTLDNGSTIVLDSAGNGAVVSQGNTQVVKVDSGQVVYRAEAAADKEVLYNTISTPRGGTYRLTLADGTRVWLNAGSSIRYPVSFSGFAARQVEISGEAYFEVANNKSLPFMVKAGSEEIKVLGTYFNVMAYTDEDQLETTLLQGSVQVIRGDQVRVIKAGEQARLKTDTSNTSNRISILDVDPDDYVAWKNGLIQLHHADIPAIMRQISRWYDVQVVYQGDHFPSWKVAGTIPRTLNLSQALQVLKLNGIHCKLEKRIVTVIL